MPMRLLASQFFTTLTRGRTPDATLSSSADPAPGAPARFSGPAFGPWVYRLSDDHRLRFRSPAITRKPRKTRRSICRAASVFNLSYTARDRSHRPDSVGRGGSAARRRLGRSKTGSHFLLTRPLRARISSAKWRKWRPRVQSRRHHFPYFRQLELPVIPV